MVVFTTRLTSANIKGLKHYAIDKEKKIETLVNTAVTQFLSRVGKRQGKRAA